MSDFSGFGLKAPILRALEEEGYTQPTPIQAQAIPYVMGGRDLLGIAQTGTGKTAAFALPMLHRLDEVRKNRAVRQCRALVLSPTRELASQIADSFKAYGRHLRLSTTVVFGGVPLGRQERALAQGVDVLVATPGRLLDLIDRRALSLAGVEILVLDEADQMLDLGFIHALRRIVTMLPRQRQSLFFSATMPKMIAGLADQLLHEPAKVAVTPVATTAERVEQSVYFASSGDKQALLRAVLEDSGVERALVFSRTKHGADRIVRNLERDGIQAAAIHGNKSQGQRERALGDFKEGRCRVLIATDIAARGIDVEAVSHVINFDLPNVPESYVHRIGRTARAGAAGVAVSFCSPDERPYLRDIERLTRLEITRAELPANFKPSAASRMADAEGARPASRPGSGRGPSHGKRRPEHHSGRPAEGSNSAQPQASRGRNQQRPSGPSKPRAPSPAGYRGEAPASSDGNLSWLDRARRVPG